MQNAIEIIAVGSVWRYSKSLLKKLVFSFVYYFEHMLCLMIVSKSMVDLHIFNLFLKHRTLFSYKSLSVWFKTSVLCPVNATVDKTFPIDTLKMNVPHSNGGPHNILFMCMHIQTFQYKENIFSEFSFSSKVIAFNVCWYGDEGTYFTVHSFPALQLSGVCMHLYHPLTFTSCRVCA